MSVDEIGNVYVVRDNNSLVRFTPDGDSSAFYRGVQNGNIEAVDATNPLRVVVYHPRYSKVVLLDRLLTLKNELDLRQQKLFQAPVVASSADGNLWVYDQFNARLKKINEKLEEVLQSNDLRQETGFVPHPVFMIERDWKVFIADTLRGILTFDRYGSYLSALPVVGVKKLQVSGSKLIYFKNDSLHSWDVKSFREQAMPLPLSETSIVDAALARNYLYVLYADRLIIYRMPEEK